AAMARLNTRGFDEIFLMKAALGSMGGFVALENEDRGSWAVQTRRLEDGDAERVGDEALPIVTVQQALATVPNGELLIVKIDIEGFEDDLFRRNLDWIDSVSVLMIETHDSLFPGRHPSANLQK